jgi:hypothetical protein
MPTFISDAYHRYGKAWAWLGVFIAIGASVLEVAVQTGFTLPGHLTAPDIGVIGWAGTWLAGTALLQQAQTRLGLWLAGGGGFALAAAGQWALRAFPDNRTAQVVGLLLMATGGLSKGALSKRPDPARASKPPAPPTT